MNILASVEARASALGLRIGVPDLDDPLVYYLVHEGSGLRLVPGGDANDIVRAIEDEERELARYVEDEPPAPRRETRGSI